MSCPSLIAGRYLATSAGDQVIPDGAMVVDGSRVVAVGSKDELCSRYPHAEVWEAGDCAILPSFVNTHHHMYGVLSHGIPLAKAPNGFWPFLEQFWWPMVEDALTHEAIAAATDWACWEMASNGIGTFYDCLEAPAAIPGALAVQAAVVERWGLRGWLSFEATERVSKDNGQAGLRENMDLVVRQRKNGGPIQGMMCFHTTFTCSPAFVAQAFALARQVGARIHMHVSEGTYEPEYCQRVYGKRTVEVYQDWGVLGPDVLASQCVQVSAQEITLLAGNQVCVSHMPLSNCEVGGGFAPVPEMLRQGVLVGLGTDGYVNDMFEVMRGAFLVHKARLQDPTVMPARTVWKLATADGARALGLRDVGWLGTGASADWISVRLDTPTPVTPHNLWDQLLLYRSGRDIEDVMVAGRWLKRRGQVLAGDVGSIRARCHEAANALWERARG